MQVISLQDFKGSKFCIFKGKARSYYPINQFELLEIVKCRHFLNRLSDILFNVWLEVEITNQKGNA